MENKKFLIGLIIGAIIPTLYFVVPPVAEALYAIPPTNAWQHVRINSNATYSSTGDTILNATSYDDYVYLLSDGSIGFNITTYP